ncbi:MAG: Rne/Rng family ribonuclease [Planctomycetota bacterium]
MDPTTDTAQIDTQAAEPAADGTAATDATASPPQASDTTTPPATDPKPKRTRSRRKRSTKKSDAAAEQSNDATTGDAATGDRAGGTSPEPEQTSSGIKLRRTRLSPKGRKMLVNYVPGDECRVAIVQDGVLEELHTEFAATESIGQNIYVGRVTNVESAIQAAFVDFGHHTNGFLHISDLHPQYFGTDETTERIGKKTPRRERPAIQDCLKKGQRVLVQVIKEGINTKGPTLSSYLSIPGRYLVMLPDMDKVGVSRKVEDEDTRKRMKDILDQLELPEGYGFILRTAGLDRTKTELKRDLAYLQRLRKDIDRRLNKGGDRPRLLYAESDLLMRTLRDLWTSEIDEIIIDNEIAVKRAARFMKIVSPRTSTNLFHYNEQAPMFWSFGVEDQISQILSRRVPLPSGGSLIIDETEAVIAIDVNSGRMRSNNDAETTAFKTNNEAVPEICRQLKLRDVGGLVICDLIDMMKRSNRKTIEKLFQDCLKSDRSATKVLPISQFGIVEMTRQRQKGSMRSQHFERLTEGGPMVRRLDSIARESLRELARLLAVDRINTVEMVISPKLAGELLSHRRQSLTRLEGRTNKTVEVRVSESIKTDTVRFYAYDAHRADVDVERLPRPKPPAELTEWPVSTAKSADDEDLREELEAEIARERRVPVREAEDDTDDSVLDGLDDVDESDDLDDTATRKRRRRRRGGRRRTGRDTDETDRDGAADAGGDATREKRAPETDDDKDEEGGGGRRRRRRRRGRRGDEESGAAEPGADTRRGNDFFVRDQRRIFELTEGEAPPKDQVNRPPLWRGDSWDVEPGELGMLAVKPANPEDIERPSMPGEEPAARRNGSNKPGRSSTPKRKRPARLAGAGVDRASAAPRPIATRGLRTRSLGVRDRRRGPARGGMASPLRRLGIARGGAGDDAMTVGGRVPVRRPARLLFGVARALRAAERRKAAGRRRRRRGGRGRRS